MKRLKKMDLFTVCNALIMTLVVLLSVYPLYYAVVNSLNDGTNTTNFGMVQLWPRQFSLDSWRMVVKDPAIPTALGITASRTVIVTVCQLIFTSMFAYAFSRPYLRFKKCYAALGFMSMYISGGIVATFLLLSKMGLYNTYWVYIIPSLFGGFYNVIIYTSNFRGIPDELFESAQLDGASEYRIFFSIVLPLSKATVAVLVLYYGLAHWNDWFAPMIYLQGAPQKYPLQLILRNMLIDNQMVDSASGGNDQFLIFETMKYAVIVVSTLPMLIFYPFVQKYFDKGVMVGSVKG